MKLSKPKVDSVMPEKWKCYDGCPVCRLLRKAAEKNLEIDQKELDEAFAKAEEEAVD